MPDLPRPVTNDQHYFARLCELVAEQNGLLRSVVAGRQADTERARPGDGPHLVELREPEPPAIPPEVPAPPATVPAAAKTTRRRAARSKES